VVPGAGESGQHSEVVPLLVSLETVAQFILVIAIDRCKEAEASRVFTERAEAEEPVSYYPDRAP